jgi:pimeloyl-ACP methyl ester carboxylesterase
MNAPLAIRTQGSNGPLALWIHGYTIDSSLWDELWQLLPGWRHVGIDLPGHGASAPLAPGETLATLGRRISGWAAAVGVQHIVGLSLGSTIALQVALEAPAAFETLTLGAPAIGGGPVEPEVGRRYKELHQMKQQLGRGSWLADRWTSSPPDLFSYARRRDDLWPKLEAVVNRHSWDELPGFAMARLATGKQSLAAISRIRARLLLLVGEWELPAFVETARLIASVSTGCRQQTLPGAGHLCMLEAPHLAARLIEEHWQARPESSLEPVEKGGG